MGNVCCQADTQKSLLESQILHANQYQETPLPAQDGYLQDWLKQTGLNIYEKQNEQIKSMKHRNLNRYYYGKWENGVPEGQGFIYQPQKLLFNGVFHKGLPQGRANIKFIDQMCEYEGQLKSGRAHGNGTVDNLKQRYRFTGEWDQSRPQKGTFTFNSDPNISDIEIQNFKSGKARINYHDGRKYQGSINTNRLVPNGHGKVTFPYKSSKVSYDGEWHNGIMHGKGKFLYTDGSSYQGEYLNGRKQGSGIFTFPNGNYYDGYFFQGKQNGVGTLYSKNKQQIKKGKWVNGVCQEVLNESDWKKQSRIASQRLSKIKQNIEQQFKKQDQLQKQESKISAKNNQYKKQEHYQMNHQNDRNFINNSEYKQYQYTNSKMH